MYRRITAEIIAYMVLKCGQDRQLRYPGAVQQTFCPFGGVLFHQFPFLVVQFPRFVEYVDRYAQFADIVQQGGYPDVVQQFSLDA